MIEMAVTVSARAHRILKKRPSYVALDAAGAQLPAYLSSLRSPSGEHVLGIYENCPGSERHAVVVGESGIYVRRDQHWDQARYSEMERVLTPNREDKHIVDEVLVRMASGALFSIPVLGGEGPQRDAWEWVRFLQHVLDDQEERR